MLRLDQPTSPGKPARQPHLAGTLYLPPAHTHIPLRHAQGPPNRSPSVLKMLRRYCASRPDRLLLWHLGAFLSPFPHPSPTPPSRLTGAPRTPTHWYLWGTCPSLNLIAERVFFYCCAPLLSDLQTVRALLLPFTADHAYSQEGPPGLPSLGGASNRMSSDQLFRISLCSFPKNTWYLIIPTPA